MCDNLSDTVFKMIQKYDDSTNLIKELDADMADMYRIGIEISKCDLSIPEIKRETTKKVAKIIKKKLEKSDFVDKNKYKKKLMNAFIHGIKAGLDSIQLTGLG